MGLKKNLALFCCLLGSVFASQVAEAQVKDENNRPNVLYIFTDDQSIRSVSCYSESHPWVSTPNIDKLAAKGVRFTHCYTGAKCVPSRGNALTGQFQFNYTKATEYWPVEFRKQGYYTGMVGKWHWNVPRYKETWDRSAVWEHHLEKEQNYYWNQSLNFNGDSIVELKEYSTDSYTDYTVKFIKKRANEDKPWYFWLCYAGVHSPYTPAERHMNQYADAPEAKIPADVFGPRPDKPDNMVNFTQWKKDRKTGKPAKFDARVKKYNKAVSAIDEGVGRIMKALEESGQLENTIVVFTSDQGYAWGQHGYMLKIAPYDANLLAPLIVHNSTKFPAGKVCEYPVNGVDLIKTFHTWGNVTPKNKLDGRDLSEILVNPDKKNWKEAPMIQSYTGISLYGVDTIAAELKRAHETGDWTPFIAHERTGTRSWMILREGKYKYIRYIWKDCIEELYDLENDPEELKNLAVKKEYHKLLSKLRKKQVKEFEKKGATFMDLLPEPKLVSK